MNVLVKSEHIETKATCKENFYFAFKAKVKQGSLNSKNEFDRFILFLLWNGEVCYGNIDEYSFWIIKPLWYGILPCFRVFFGSYYEENGKVVAVGDFEYPQSWKDWNAFLGVIMAFFAYVGFRSIVPALPSFLFSLCVGAAGCGLLIGLHLLSSRPSEKEVVKLLSSLK